MVPLKSKDGSVIITDAVGIMARWTEHFTDLYDNPSATDESVINGLPHKEILTEMMTDPTYDEVKSTIEEVNTEKSPRLDGIPVELLRCGGDNIATTVYTFILGIWHDDPVPRDWVDVIMLPLYKSKGSKSNSGDYRGISLLEAVGKVSLQGPVEPTDKVDFNTVNRTALWIILGKLGCPPQFVEMLKQLHRNMKASDVNGLLSESIPVDNGVKQRDIPAPTLFSIYFAVMLSYAFQDCDIGIFIRFRTSGKVFNLRRFNTKSKTFHSLVLELLFTDDADLVAHTKEDMQLIMDIFSRSCLAFGLTINLKKTKVMHTTPIGQVHVEPNSTVEGNRLGVVDSFVYLGRTLSRNGSLDAEISRRIAKASTAFGKLEKRVWSDRGITTNTKLSVY